MMESMDDWIIDSKNTPTISYMMENGINFTEMYTPKSYSGYTFSTEFAFNLSIYPYINGKAYSLTKNQFDYSLPNLFKQNGYTVNSFHCGTKEFYNRGEMHKAFGYEQYHSYYDFPDEKVSRMNDLYLTESDKLWETVTNGDKWMSYVITYSPHLPYEEDELVNYAATQHEQYNREELSPEECLRAKASITDDMFAQILTRLEEKGILEDTVIVAFSDHYAYGLDDEALLNKLSIDAGHSILENTPAFIYCADYTSPMKVTKVSQITDLGPTIANMCGVDIPMKVMGKDIFDEHYEGYVFFSNNTWLTNKAYVKDGITIWNNGMSDKEILEMSNRTKEARQVNDAILDSDYYRYLKTKQ